MPADSKSFSLHRHPPIMFQNCVIPIRIWITIVSVSAIGFAHTTNFHFEPTSSPNGIVYIIGDVRQVLEGKMPPGTEEKTWSAKGLVGFGAGAIGPLAGLGEAIYANGEAFVRTTDNESVNYFQTIRHSEFRSSFSLFVDQSAVEDGRARYQNPTDPATQYTLLDFHKDVYGAVEGNAHCFHGNVHFSQMEAIAISKAPIYGEPIDGNYTDGGYYSQPPFSIPDTHSNIFACAANYSTVRDPALIEKLKRGLYVNPNDPGSATELLIHSHGITMDPPGRNGRAEGPGAVYHFLSTSSIKEISVKVFVIDSVDKLQDLQQNKSNGTSYYAQFSLVLICSLSLYFKFC